MVQRCNHILLVWLPAFFAKCKSAFVQVVEGGRQKKLKLWKNEESKTQVTQPDRSCLQVHVPKPKAGGVGRYGHLRPTQQAGNRSYPARGF